MAASQTIGKARPRAIGMEQAPFHPRFLAPPGPKLGPGTPLDRLGSIFCAGSPKISPVDVTEGQFMDFRLGVGDHRPPPSSVQENTPKARSIPMEQGVFHTPPYFWARCESKQGGFETHPYRQSQAVSTGKSWKVVSTYHEGPNLAKSAGRRKGSAGGPPPRLVKINDFTVTFEDFPRVPALGRGPCARTARGS